MKQNRFNKKRRLSELKDKLLQNGYSEDEFLEVCYHNESKNWTLQSLMTIISNQGYTESNISNFFKQKNYELWIKLISADWFSIFLTYLDVKDIVRLDSAFTNHEDRPKWLRLLKMLKPSIAIDNNQLADSISGWLIQKNVHPSKVSLKYQETVAQQSLVISESYTLRLFQNSPNLESFELENFTSSSMNHWWPSCIASFCTDLEYLKICDKNSSKNSLEILSKRCHKLKSLDLIGVNYLGLDNLLKVNRNLVSVDLHLKYDSNVSGTFIGDIFEILGQCCPLLQYCKLQNSKIRATDIQIDTFTKGCTNLKSLWIKKHESGFNVYHKLLHALGRYNTALEELTLTALGSFDDDNNTPTNVPNSLSIEQSTSLQSLSNGFPSLHKLTLNGQQNLSTSNTCYLLNHTTNLRELNLDLSQVCQDGGVITKDKGKLKYLERLELNSNRYITDESITNIVKDCYNVEYIDIIGCSKLTDTCLFSIAENCPNLETIDLEFDDVKITLLGIMELLKKCLKLTYIYSGDEELPDIIVDELKKREK